MNVDDSTHGAHGGGVVTEWLDEYGDGVNFMLLSPHSPHLKWRRWTVPLHHQKHPMKNGVNLESMPQTLEKHWPSACYFLMPNLGFVFTALTSRQTLEL